MSNNKKLIRNSTTEFLIFTSQSGETSIEARYEDNTIWLSQKMMSALFDVEENTITYHLKEIYKSNEIEKDRTTRKFRVVQQEGERTVNRNIDFYNLDRLFESDFDKEIKKQLRNHNKE